MAGIILGPEAIGWVNPRSLGDLLPVLVSISVGIILFEGGLTLDLKNYGNSSTMIRRLLTVGVLVTWLVGAVVVWGVFRIDFEFALLTASLVIVTGPTVIVPLLKRIKAVPRVSNILHWEGVLIDAIGVFIAVLCYEWIVSGQQERAILNFIHRFGFGSAIGLGGGWIIDRTIRLKWIPDDMVNGFVLAAGVMVFGLSQALASESGLLAATLAGLYLGWKAPAEIKEIRHFKGEITDLLIGMLFILLVARLDLAQFLDFGWRGALAVAGMIFLVRPLSVLVSSIGIGMPWREKAFLAWVAPRGIVAASLASLFALSLEGDADPTGGVVPALLESFTYSVICVTVVLQGFTSGWVAKALGLCRPDPVGWLVVGAHPFARELASKIGVATSRSVVLVDSNIRNVDAAREEGLTALHGDALDADALGEREELADCGNLLALTDNVELNELLRRQWESHFGRSRCFAWKPLSTPSGRGPREHFRPEGSVFGNVGRPSLVSEELARGESWLTLVDAPEAGVDPALEGGVNALAIIRKEALNPLSDDGEAGSKVIPGDSLIILTRSRGFLRRALERGRLVDLAVDSMDAGLEEMSRAAVAVQPALVFDEILSDLRLQQASFPAYLGNGVAIPHIYSSMVPGRMCLFGHAPSGLSLPDGGEVISLVFFIISPTGDAEGHLATLAEIARLCRDPRHLAALGTATSLDDLLEIL